MLIVKNCRSYFDRTYTHAIDVVVVVAAVAVVVVVATTDIVGMVQFDSLDCTPGVVVVDVDIAEEYRDLAAAAGSASVRPKCCCYPARSMIAAGVHNVESEWFV